MYVNQKKKKFELRAIQAGVSTKLGSSISVKIEVIPENKARVAWHDQRRYKSCCPACH
jgi:hypothetical protein